MRILMLGNSFTFYNDMPSMLAEITGAEVISHTRGGARLVEQLNPETQMGAETLAALANESWDYVVLQEQSNAPVTSRKAFLKAVRALCDKIRAAGAVPVLYATWAYERGNDWYKENDSSYELFYKGISDAYHEAAQQNDALIAEVGRKFYEQADQVMLYQEDRKHPNEAGSRLAAETIAEVIGQAGIFGWTGKDR